MILNFTQYAKSKNYKVSEKLTGKLRGYIVRVNYPHSEVYEWKQLGTSVGYYELMEITAFLKEVNNVY